MDSFVKGMMTIGIFAVFVIFFIPYYQTYLHEELHARDCTSLNGTPVIRIYTNFTGDLSGRLFDGRTACYNLSDPAASEWSRLGAIIDG